MRMYGIQIHRISKRMKTWGNSREEQLADIVENIYYPGNAIV